MVEIYSKEADKPKTNNYGLNPITMKTFLASVCNSYPKGVLCKVKRHSSIFSDRYTKKPRIYIVIEVLSQMENCLAIEIEDGAYKKTRDEMGNLQDVYTLMDATFSEVSLLFKLEKGKQEGQYKIARDSVAHPFFSFAVKSKGMLDESYEGSFDLTFEEIQDCVNELEFLPTSELDEEAFKPRHILYPKPSPLH